MLLYSSRPAHPDFVYKCLSALPGNNKYWKLVLLFLSPIQTGWTICGTYNRGQLLRHSFYRFLRVVVSEMQEFEVLNTAAFCIDDINHWEQFWGAYSRPHWKALADSWPKGSWNEQCAHVGQPAAFIWGPSQVLFLHLLRTLWERLSCFTSQERSQSPTVTLCMWSTYCSSVFVHGHVPQQSSPIGKRLKLEAPLGQ